ncbi:MAG: GTPase Era [Ruminococcaceae bacterium]|nr:GTPase Era [Oscillospiraceae bacterium]
MSKSYKSGFAAIIGMPNVGKSTLLNKIAGQKVAIVSPKPQTTRNKILAIHTTDSYQVVFTDTPGIHRPRTKLGEYMVKVAKESMSETDILIFVVDATRKMSEMEKEIAENIGRIGLPAILVINKADAVKKELLLPIIAEYASLHAFDAVLPISAKMGDGIDLLMNEIEKYLEEGPQFYYEDMVTDQPEKQIAAEIIREKLLRLLDQEVPHGIAVEIESMKEKETITDIHAVIYCEKASHKGIIIGKNGEMLKKIGRYARADIEEMLDKQVYLELWVRVKDDWRNSERMMKNFGYDSKM